MGLTFTDSDDEISPRRRPQRTKQEAARKTVRERQDDHKQRLMETPQPGSETADSDSGSAARGVRTKNTQRLQDSEEEAEGEGAGEGDLGSEENSIDGFIVEDSLGQEGMTPHQKTEVDQYRR
jgi:hypothetical protein